MPDSDQPRRVFISYSHDSEEHEERVLELANRLRSEGIDAWIDLFEPHPPQGWPRWMQERIEWADFVVLVCTETYRRRFEGKEMPGVGRGVSWEGRLLGQEVYEASGMNPRIVPVLFDDGHESAIPLIMRAYTFYRVLSGYDELYRRLTDQPRAVPAPLGEARKLQAIAPRSKGIPCDLPAPEGAALEAIKILFMASEPSGNERTQFDREFRQIERKLQASEYRDAIETAHMMAVQPGDVVEGLLRHSPHIVHFTGHGSPQAILLVDEQGQAKAVSKQDLAGALGTLKGKLRLVFLNACYSAERAQAFAEHVDFVVGMGWQIGVEAASAFASSFYLAVGFGRSVQQAFDVAKASLMLEGIPEGSTPQLLVRPGADPNEALCRRAGAGTEPEKAARHITASPATAPKPARPSELAGPLVELPAKLVRQLEPLRDKMHKARNAILPVVGSDLCTPALPSWSAFLASLIDLAPDELAGELREMLALQQYLDVAELLEAEREVGPPQIAEQIRQTYQRPEAQPPEKIAIYDLVAALPCTHFATTHYEPWLKEAVSRRYPAPRVYAPRDPSAFSEIGPESSPLVLMLHGDADRPEHCVLSQRSYRRLVHGLPEYRRALSALAGQRSFLFIGHALNDPDIVAVLEEWVEIFAPDGAAPRHYFLGVDLRQRDRLKLQRLGVMPIEYGKKGDTSLLPAVLCYLARNPAIVQPDKRPNPAASDDERYRQALARYARWVRQHYSHLDMAGLGGGQLRLSLDDIFVPLRFSTRGPRDGKRSDDPRGSWDLHGLHGMEQRAIGLEDAFRHAAPASHLFILGDPGSGKTTALKKLMWSVVDQSRGEAFDGSSLGLSPDAVPVFVRLRSLGPGHLQQSLAELLDAQLAAIEESDIGKGLGRWLWERGHLLLLLDGLDEVADPERRADVCSYLREQLDSAHEQGKMGIRAAVSCRYAGLASRVGLGDGFAKLDIHPLDDKQIERLTTRWFAAAESKMAESTGKDRERGYQLGFRRGLELAETLRSNDELSARRIKELVANPLLLTLLCVVVFHGRVIPRRRAEFFRDCLSTLVKSWRQQPLLQLEDALSLLEPLAWALHTQRRKDLFGQELREIMQPEIDRLERKLNRRLTIGGVVDWLNRDTGVLAKLSAREYGFMHLSLQEYLCARHAAKRSQSGLPVLVEHFGEPWWREVVLLFVALSEHTLFGDLMRPVVASDKLLEYEVLLRECLEEAHELDSGPFVEVMESEEESGQRQIAAMRLLQSRADDRIRQAAVGIAARRDVDSGLRAMAERIAGKELLATMAIPGKPFEDETTGIRFLWIPGGRFRMGLEEVWPGMEKYDKASLPAHWVEVSPFWLGETAVTNGQYEKFLQATGYKEPESWRDRRFNGPEQPVIGVTWPDARAFCEWLSGLLDRQVDLPTESQWEFAARGTENRLYPWGDQTPDESLADFGQEWQTGQPRPVGSFPGGAGPYGTLDQAGNVWEWCRNVAREDDYKGRGDLMVYPFEGEGSDQDPRTTVPACRGGSWDFSAQYLRAAYRSGLGADVAYDNLGFRVACLPAAEPGGEAEIQDSTKKS